MHPNSTAPANAGKPTLPVVKRLSKKAKAKKPHKDFPLTPYPSIRPGG